ncbi:ABC transporter permease [Streptacidiphilus jiangxiensis]|uniref:Ribose transport system permease protein n=1 Tax=Streptacidiphilus jiangxiensis TaxID=235985 RepID=A0A1H7HI20_STRJI|nr:ABC transporter permease [Streptacidiphilus jiangxiensis]SEK49949.1 ribose transport system permease protein [Streptacidiphilus jiangxiensis]
MTTTGATDREPDDRPPDSLAGPTSVSRDASQGAASTAAPAPGAGRPAAPAAPATVPAPTAAARPLLLRAASVSEVWTFLILAGLVVFFTLAAPRTFFTTYDLTQIAVNAAIYLVLGVGMTFVVITAGIDLSIGSVLVLAAVAAGEYNIHHGGADAGWWTVAVCALIALGVGAAWGALQGLVVATGKVPPLIVTLGGLGAALGIAELATGGQDPADAAAAHLQNSLGYGKLLGIPWLVILAAVVTLAFGLLLGTTRFGTHTFAIGSNPAASRRAGVAVGRHLVKVYALMGLLAGLGAVMWLASYGTTSIAGHSTDNLRVITAVVLGGTSLFGGRGSVLGTVIGVFIPAVLTTGLIVIGVQQYWQDVAVGVVLVAAVHLDQMRRRTRERT